MTDLRSLDSAPDSQFDFGELDKEREGTDSSNKMNAVELFKKDRERQKKGLPPMFAGPTGDASALKNITSDQFSLKNKSSITGMPSLPSGPIKPNKLESK